MSVASLKDKLANGSTPPFYLVGEYKAMIAEKDAHIAELEARIASPRQVGGYYIVPREDYDAMKFRIGDLEDAIAKNAKAVNAKENRLTCEDGKYDKSAVDGINLDGATKAAELAESMLGSGRNLSYAAACLLVLHRELEDVSRKNSILAERNGNLANGIKELSRLTITN